MFFDLDRILAVLPALLTIGLKNTLILATASTVLGLVFGMLLALGVMSRIRPVRWSVASTSTSSVGYRRS